MTANWKILLSIAGIVILLASLLYTDTLARKLKEQERKSVEITRAATAYIASLPDDDYDTELAFPFFVQQNAPEIPTILEKETGELTAYHFGIDKDNDTAFLRQELMKLKADNVEPIVIEGQSYTHNIYYKQSKLLTLLSYFPLVQLALVLGFLILGYIGITNMRKAEQNRVWAGMAKETAHQLGTPISAIIAWSEYLKTLHDDEATAEVVRELDKDVKRLELIADRFSKIGSEPKLKGENIYVVLNHTKEYMQNRSPRKVSYSFPDTPAEPLVAKVNPQLFHWVLENLMRNALDAMDGTGVISSQLYEDGKYVCIEISDTGKGIPSSKFKTIFKPGYSTKKRGWGLGLSLAKRIVETYHKGKIYVKESKPNEKTTFVIKVLKYTEQ